MRQVGFLAAAALLAGCVVDLSQTRGQAPEEPASLVEKYEECMTDMRGDVFAERTCQVYLEAE
jgi:hypothetical protein